MVPLGIIIVSHIKKVRRLGKVQDLLSSTNILLHLQENVSAAELTSVID